MGGGERDKEIDSTHHTHRSKPHLMPFSKIPTTQKQTSTTQKQTLPLSIYLYLSISLLAYPSLYLSVYLYLSISLLGNFKGGCCLCLSLYVSVCLCLSLFASVCLSHRHTHSLYTSLPSSLSSSLPPPSLSLCLSVVLTFFHLPLRS